MICGRFCDCSGGANPLATLIRHSRVPRFDVILHLPRKAPLVQHHEPGKLPCAEDFSVATLPFVAASAAARGQTPVSPRPSDGRAPDPATSAPGFQLPEALKFDRPDVHAGDRPVGASFGSRSAAFGTSGACGTAHPLATLAAIEILKRGGSAVDAAVTANACLGFLEPTSSGLGGDCYAMLWDPKAGKLMGLAGSGRSPKSLSPRDSARALDQRHDRAARRDLSLRAGALDAWWTLHQRYGRLPWKDVLEPAIALCESGVPVPPMISYYIHRNMELFNEPGHGIEEVRQCKSDLRAERPRPEGGRGFPQS